jgi:hypothetical protein
MKRLKNLQKTPKNITIKYKSTLNTPKKDKIKTLATTMVEECNRLETGVGPSMALGNQLLNTVNDDFVRMASPTKKESSLTSQKNRKKSLTRLIKKASIEPFCAKNRLLNVIIKK